MLFTRKESIVHKQRIVTSTKRLIELSVFSTLCAVNSLTLEVTPSATQFFEQSYKISKVWKLDFQSEFSTMWSINDGLSGNLRGWFLVGFRRFLLIKKSEKKVILIKNLETCRKSPWPVSWGFHWFPDNPSLTDHTVSFFFG